MKMNSVTLNPKFSFSKVSHRYPKKEEYIISKKISEIKNTPVSPSFLKRIVHGISSFYHKIDMTLFVRSIKSINNNKMFNSSEKLKIDNVIYENQGDIDRRENLISMVGENDKKNLFLNEISNEYREEINNSNVLNDLIYNSDAKFDFYSFSHYLTEVKKAKDYFSLSNNLDDITSNEHDLFNVFSIIINNRLNALNVDDFKNIYKLITKIYNFEKIHLNKKYDFMSNFSSVKERDKFISCINLLVIAEDELGVLSNSDKVLSEKIKHNLSTIMKVALGNKDNKNASFKKLIMEWRNIYINGCDFQKYRSSDEELKENFGGVKLFSEEEMKWENKKRELNILLDNSDLIAQIEKIEEEMKLKEEVKEEEIKEEVMDTVDETEEETKRLAREKADKKADEIIKEIKRNANNESIIKISELEIKDKIENREDKDELLNKSLNIFSSMEEMMKKYNEINLIDEKIKEILSDVNQEIKIDFNRHVNEAREIMTSIRDSLVSIKSSKERVNTEVEENDPYHEIKNLLIKLKENLNFNISDSIGETTKIPIKNNIKELMNEFDLYLSKMRGMLLDDDLTQLNNITFRSENVLKSDASKINGLDFLNKKIDDIEYIPEEAMSINFDENDPKIEDSISLLMEKINKEINRKVINKKEVHNYSISSGSDFVTKTKENIEKNRKLRSEINNPVKNKVLDKAIKNFIDNTIDKENEFQLLKNEIENVQEKNKRKKEQYKNERIAPMMEGEIEKNQGVGFGSNELETKENLNIDKSSNKADIDNRKGFQSNFVFEGELYDILFDKYKEMKHYKIESPFVVFEFNKDEKNNDKIKFNYTNGSVLYLINKKIKSNKSLIKDYINSGIEKSINEFINKKMESNAIKNQSEEPIKSPADKEIDSDFKLAINSIVTAIDEDLSNKSNQSDKKIKK
ncbi:hypothetical protein [Proteus hauseri]|uniref:hypothetical protein n=1 Tax=Proteus hauseri TaxID=183417 RepID=UPI0032DBA824